jgi:hypothetical protein
MSRLLWRPLAPFLYAGSENSTAILANRLVRLDLYPTAALTEPIGAGDLNSSAEVFAVLNNRTDLFFFYYRVLSAMRRPRGANRSLPDDFCRLIVPLLKSIPHPARPQAGAPLAPVL